MRIKTPNTTGNLVLYAFLGLLFAAASTVDIDKMTTSAMEHQTASVENYIDSNFR